MKIFLKEIVKKAFEQYNTELYKVSLVFPNKRPGVFAQKYLSEIIDKPNWMPNIYTINELMCNCSDYKQADDLLLISKLYDTYKLITGTKETFDDFYFWGEMLLSDFNDIDKYMVNAKDLFQNLSSVKAIEDNFSYLTESQVEAITHFWSSFDKGKYTNRKDQFIQVWEKLINVYTGFKEQLAKEGIAYEGMIYRDIAEKISENKQIENLPEKLIFIGFNALNKCEEVFFKYFAKSKTAEFYWDYDSYYVENDIHEAGKFVRKNIEQYPASKLEMNFDTLTADNKVIKAISVPSEISQTKVCYDILETIPASEYSETVVVLADEHLLLPVLYSIPGQINDLNVTMGYPLKDTPVFSLISNIVDLQKNIRLNKKNEASFYYKYVLNILNHQYIIDSKGVDKIIKEIHKYNKIYIRQNELENSELIKLVFSKINSIDDIGEYLLNILYELNKRLFPDAEEDKRFEIEQEYIFCLYKAVNRLNEVLSTLKHKFSIDMYLKLLSQYIREQRVSFEGEPLLGLQIMGLLETRVLDFKNVIVLSMNEGILPSTNNSPSFIPYNIRKGFGLQTIEYQDTIYAYTFYRLIQRANNVHLIYSNVNSGLSIGEKSRYIHQMVYSPDFAIEEQSLGFDIDVEKEKEITIIKDQRVNDILDQYIAGENASRRLSPSAINTYLSCSLKFYFRYIARMEETETLSEEVDGMLFGNLYHQAMYEIYKDFKNKQLDKTDIETLLKDNAKIENSINYAFRHDFFNIDDDSVSVEISGKNILIFDILKKYIIQTLKRDIQYAPFSITGLEDKFETVLNIVVNNKNIDINIYGKIDRVDQKEGIVRILDYKTGAAELKYKGLEQLFSAEIKERNSAVMQTFMYSYLYKKQSSKSQDIIIPGIFVLKNIFNSNYDYRIYEQVGPKKYNVIDNFNTIENEFVENLKNVVGEIFNKEMTFAQTKDLKNCEYCPYSNICERR